MICIYKSSSQQTSSATNLSVRRPRPNAWNQTPVFLRRTESSSENQVQASPPRQQPALFSVVVAAPPATCAQLQNIPEHNVLFQQSHMSASAQTQPAASCTSPEQCSEMNLGPQNSEMLQQMPPMDCMPPEMYGVQPQFVPQPMFSPEPALVPVNGVVPSPGYVHNMTYNGENLNYRFYHVNAVPQLYNGGFLPQIPHHFGIPMQPFPLYIPAQKMPKTRRPHAIAIIDPETGNDKLNEIYGDQAEPVSNNSREQSKPNSKKSSEKDSKPTVSY